MKDGLGANNPLTALDAYDLLDQLVHIVEKEAPECQYYQSQSGILHRMAKQDTSGSLNFKHGHAYVSASIYNARTYA